MPTSAQITALVNSSPNPEEKKHEIWKKSRYLVAQKAAHASSSLTQPGYYQGRVVVPGPNANSKLSDTLGTHDLDILENKHFIRFIDNATTDEASADIAQANYTIMSNQEADDYEKLLKKYYAEFEPERVSE